MTPKSINILMVEDNPTDVMLAREALAVANVNTNLQVAEDGVVAMQFLGRLGEHANAPRPDVILLDLNMPRKSGQEVLAEIKADENLKYIPIVVLTTSTAEKDVRKAYGLYANCYISKPVDFDAFTEIVQAIQRFWFTVVILPSA